MPSAISICRDRATVGKCLLIPKTVKLWGEYMRHSKVKVCAYHEKRLKFYLASLRDGETLESEDRQIDQHTKICHSIIIRSVGGYG